MTHPGKLAMFDQARAAFGGQIEILVDFYTANAAVVGDGQACANLCVYIEGTDLFNEVVTRSMLATSIQTIAEFRAAQGSTS